MADKYTLAEKEALLAKGHALPPSTEGGDPGYPIADSEDLDNAILAVGRGGADHDDIRKYIIGRAADLDESSKIPDNWNADGSLDESKSIVLTYYAPGVGADTLSRISHTAEELRFEFYQDARNALNDAVAAAYKDDDDFGGIYVEDFSDTEVIFENYGSGDPGPGTWCQTYTNDNDSVTLTGEPVRVNSHTTYEEVSTPPAVTKTNGSVTLSHPTRSGGGRHSNTPPPAREFRMFTARGLEVREDVSGDPNVLIVTGMPITYGQPYEVNDMFGSFEETMHRGACKDILGSQNLDVRFLFNHDGLPLGRTTAGTLSLAERDNGLACAVQLDTRQSLANDLAIAIDRKDVNQMSVGFVVARDKWNASMDVRDIYSIKELFDVSAVTYPASPTTSIEIGQRMWDQVPIESRSRVRRMWQVSAEIRAGKVVSASNAALLQDAFDVLSTVDTDGLAKGAEHASSVNRAKTNLGAVLAAAVPVTADDDGTASGSSGEDGSPSVRSDKEVLEPVKTVSNTRARLLLLEQADEQRRLKTGFALKGRQPNGSRP
jgi:hypothetical protein